MIAPMASIQVCMRLARAWRKSRSAVFSSLVRAGMYKNCIEKVYSIGFYRGIERIHGLSVIIFMNIHSEGQGCALKEEKG